MRVVLFYHSLVSDWNHGNAHFLRGVVRELTAQGHEVEVYEPRDGWSRSNLVAEHGIDPLRGFAAAFPGMQPREYRLDALDLDGVLDGADLVLVHEWNTPELVRRIGRHRRDAGDYLLLFHDTHHRSVSAPDEMARFDLADYDGVLAFGDVISEIYRRRGWAQQVWTWHEAADEALFHPLPGRDKEGDLVWVGNWGDEERTAELHAYLFEPIRALGLKARIYGVRYPDQAQDAVRRSGADYAGWLANFRVPEVLARYRATVHVPRRQYATILAGIPTIRVFEALACGVPLVSAPWEDTEGLFRPGDFLIARDSTAMTRHLRALLEDTDMATEMAARGLATIRSRHTCRHRVDELLAICSAVGHGAHRPAAASDALVARGL